MSDNEKLEVLLTAKEYAGRLIEGIDATVQLFQGGNEGRANENMLDIIDGLQWLISAISSTWDIQREKIHVSDINEHLAEMVSAFENTDYVLLADLLEYEITPVLKDWEEALALTVGA